MSSEPFVSFAPNREDVVLFRALHDVPVGGFLDLGVRGPVDRSISHAFARRGWAGAVLAAGEPSVGLTAPAGDLHFVVVDAAPAERITLLGQVLPDTGRPWVLVLRDSASGRPARPDPADLEAFGAQGYDLCLNDGVSLFLVDRARSAVLAEALSLPANVLDEVIYQRDLARDELLADLSVAASSRSGTSRRIWPPCWSGDASRWTRGRGPRRPGAPPRCAACASRSN